MLLSPCKGCLVKPACSMPCKKLIDRLRKNEKIVEKILLFSEATYRIIIVIVLLGIFLIGIWGAFINCAR